MKNLFKCIVLSVFLIGLVSCSSDDDSNSTPDSMVTFVSVLDGNSTVPATGSTGTGTATLVYNTDTKIFVLTGTHTGVVAVNGHIHLGAVGVSGGVVFPLDSFDSPMSLTSPVLNAVQEADLMANLYYVNIHTALFPSGEIRGQLIKQ
ncbi:CHRD domain-containing protein [Changchengzhania lutea]|uniref:CHRD domain-containing protein n=1 Tax=Changchengzhania lutea TaxID=2049305 RepID=UPI00115E3002|nr:CHRD domain-containing protein [Changchengzhania lutea]